MFALVACAAAKLSAPCNSVRRDPGTDSVPGFSFVPLGAERKNQFYRGKKNSFRMRLSAGKLTPVSKALKVSTALEVMRFTRLRVVEHVMR